MGTNTIHSQIPLQTQLEEVQQPEAVPSVIVEGSGKIASETASLHTTKNQIIPQTVILLSALSTEAEKSIDITLSLSSEAQANADQDAMPIISSGVAVHIEDESLVSAEKPQQLLTKKYAHFTQGLDKFSGRGVLTSEPGGRIKPLTRLQRVVAAISIRLFNFFFPIVKEGMSRLKEEIFAMLPLWGDIAQQYQSRVEKMSLTAIEIKSLFDDVILAMQTYEKKLEKEKMADIQIHGHASDVAKAYYMETLSVLIKEDLEPKKELVTDIPIDGVGSEKFGNLFGLDARIEALVTPLDGQFIKDVNRQAIVINGKEFVNNAEGSYRGQKLNSVLEQDQKNRNAYERMPIQSFLSKAFIQALKEEFGATDEEITTISYFISQRATFYISAMLGSGHLGLPEGSAPFNVDTLFSISKGEDGSYRIVASYELENPPYLVISDQNESRTYLYEQSESRQDFVKFSVALDLRMQEGKPVVQLADEGIQYDIHLTMTKGGQWM